MYLMCVILAKTLNWKSCKTIQFGHTVSDTEDIFFCNRKKNSSVTENISSVSDTVCPNRIYRLYYNRKIVPVIRLG